MLQSYLQKVRDSRRRQGQRYDLGNMLFLCILAILSGAVSYRKIHAFIKEHFELLREAFGLKWRRPPAYVTIRNVLHGVDAASLESAFREYSRELATKTAGNMRVIACDGKNSARWRYSKISKPPIPKNGKG